MLGGQQIPAYKTIMKTPQHLPRHSKSDVRLFRIIVWGAFIAAAACIAAMVAVTVAELEPRPQDGSALLSLATIPVALSLLLCWWLADVAPTASRWLIASIAFLVSIGCLVLAWLLPGWEKVQPAFLFIYAVVVAREAWRQIQAAKLIADKPEAE